MEALRAREVPVGCNSVYSMFRAMMNVSLHSKELIRAAVAALKLFYPDWHQGVGEDAWILDDTTYETFTATCNPEHFSHPLNFISEMRCTEDFETGKAVMEMFAEVLDTRKAAAVLSVLINNLRGNLKEHIPLQDRQFLPSHGENSHNHLNTWLCNIAERAFWSTVPPPSSQQDVGNEMPGGRAEHATMLKHPYRFPLSCECKR